MSKSYKKTPCYKDCNKGMKTTANRVLRHTTFDEIPNGNAYRKFFCSYDISDYKFMNTFLEYVYWFKRREDREPNPEELKKLYTEWKKFYICK